MDRGKGAKRMIALLGMLFLLMNVVWLIHYASYSKYVNAEAGDSRLAMRTSYYFEESGITYTVKRPNYLRVHGNLASDSGNGIISIIAWPSAFSKSILEYGLMLYDEPNERGYMFYVDENMNFDEEKNEDLAPDVADEAKAFLEENKGRIYKQFQMMKEEFNI